MDQLSAFVQDRWILIVAALIVIFIVIKLVKAVVKWVIVIAIVAGLIIYGANYKEQLTDIKDQIVSTAKEEAFKAMAGEAKNATYTATADGGFTVKSTNLQLDGKTGSGEVTISFRGQKIGTFKSDEAIEAFIAQAKQNK